MIEVAPPRAEPIADCRAGSRSRRAASREPPPQGRKIREIGRQSRLRRRKPVEPVIPLVHAPDDPGPDLGLDRDPVPGTSTPPASDAWQRLRQLFR